MSIDLTKANASLHFRFKENGPRLIVKDSGIRKSFSFNGIVD